MMIDAEEVPRGKARDSEKFPSVERKSTGFAGRFFHAGKGRGYSLDSYSRRCNVQLCLRIELAT